MISQTLKIIAAQLNLKVGDIHVNQEKIIQAIYKARDELKGDIIVFPELTITGYPPEDLLLRNDFHQEVNIALQAIMEISIGIDVVVGHPHYTAQGIFNAASVYQNGKCVLCYHKQFRPNYSVFDEKRYFKAGTEAGLFKKNGINIAVVICEDLWREPPAEKAKAAGAELLLSLNASPFHVDKPKEREAMMCNRAQQQQLPIIYVHCVGGQDTLVFDGGSLAINSYGEVCQRVSFYEERLSTIECLIDASGKLEMPHTALTELPSEEASIYSALRLGVRDYVKKNNFNGVYIGLSGGIDSALTLAIAVDALGQENVTAIMLPSRYTSEMSLSDANALAQSLGVQYKEISIEPAFNAFLASLHDELSENSTSLTKENIQARCRAIVLMALANEHRCLLLTTSNKSEMAMGYSTLYGDMAGTFGVLGDVYKTWVYRLAAYRNKVTPIIPKRIIERAPTAELAYHQTDQDTLPPYPILDEILYQFVEEDKTVDEIVTMGFDRELIKKIIYTVSANEFKRRQAPPCVRISKRAFGRDRRYPITSGFNPN